MKAEQRVIQFNGDDLIAIRHDDGTVYVPVKPICERLGVDWSSQAKRIKRDSILNKNAMSMVVMTTDINPSSRRPKNTTMLCLPLEFLNGWLFGISEQRVKPELKAALLTYKEDVYRVLYEAFIEKKPVVSAETNIDAIIAADPDLSSVIDIANAMITLARSQAALRADVADHEQRIQLIEADLGDDGRYITNSQARRVADAVQSVAFQLGRQSGRNAHASVYNELYRRFEIPDYRSLPAAKFDECMNWLRQWWENFTDGDVVPF